MWLSFVVVVVVVRLGPHLNVRCSQTAWAGTVPHLIKGCCLCAGMILQSHGTRQTGDSRWGAPARQNREVKQTVRRNRGTATQCTCVDMLLWRCCVVYIKLNKINYCIMLCNCDSCECSYKIPLSPDIISQNETSS